MAIATFDEQIAQHGPDSAPRDYSLDEAQAYCRAMANSHYENFTVVSWLLPRKLRPHFYSIYAWCRWADNLADEADSSDESLRLLDWWEDLLDQMYGGQAFHPVFVALAETVKAYRIPPTPFKNLLSAFRQDQTKQTYQNSDELLAYCQNSANPVGELILYLAECHRPAAVKLSDSVCTGLQLANFWQDVYEDFDRGRIYLPEDARQRAGYTQTMLQQRVFNPQFRQLLQQQVIQARQYLIDGKPLISQLPGRMRCDMALFIEGGLGILNRIEQIDFNVWQQRPKIRTRDKVLILARSCKAMFYKPTLG